MEEFRRMCREYRWGRYDPKKDEAHDLFKDALTQQFNAIYGTDVNDINSWRNLCQVLLISPIPEGLKACRQAVEETHVNLVDLVDTQGTGGPVVKFASEMKLSVYTRETRKFFPKENAYTGGLLRHLLRRIMSPSAETDETRRGVKAEAEMKKAEDDAKEARRQAEESRLAAEAEKKVLEEEKRKAEEAFLRAEEEKRLAEEEADRAKAEQLEADERAAEAQRQADAAKAAQQKAVENLQVQATRADEAETKWMRGDRPVVWPTLEEIESAKIRFYYTEGKFHFAIAGLAGSGKSSLINAFRGLNNNDPRAANTGIVETTLHVTGYPDPDPKNPFIWYDIPGAGTLEIPDWQYFNAQGLFVFDCIIVLIDNRFSATDIAILENCKRFNIPSYIVRSKANQHVLNVMNDMGYDFMTDDGSQRAEMLPAARARFIAETRQSVKANLEKAGLPPKMVYIVSKDAMVAVIKPEGKAIRKDALMDEVQLVEDILKEATRRRVKQEQRA
ncbi:hypothetical protein JAAARDRAFT_434156 [Jaapia argillacea MUCL 33604]|uniref:IRG-type G domain-containing protein n=1 Tax=Jaapia argillacea MUCL 33604 TaxID=933084 RepID=A0A067PST4_9AGAM|nr:hypothetical protein JAAARDRAFT_434156 [Jaapia argillacea MUCL 33604]